MFIMAVVLVIIIRKIIKENSNKDNNCNSNIICNSNRYSN